MAGAKKSSQTDTASGIVTSNTPNTRFVSKQRLLQLVVAVVIVGALLGGYLIWNHQHSTPKTPEQVAAQQYKTTVSQLQKQADSATTKADKAKAYSQLAQTAANSGNYSQAITYGQQSSDNGDTAANEASIAFAAQQSGNYELAASAYGKAAALSPKSTNPDESSDYNYFIQMQQEMKSKL